MFFFQITIHYESGEKSYPVPRELAAVGRALAKDNLSLSVDALENALSQIEVLKNFMTKVFVISLLAR